MSEMCVDPENCPEVDEVLSVNREIALLYTRQSSIFPDRWDVSGGVKVQPELFSQFARFGVRSCMRRCAQTLRPEFRSLFDRIGTRCGRNFRPHYIDFDPLLQVEPITRYLVRCKQTQGHSDCIRILYAKYSLVSETDIQLALEAWDMEAGTVPCSGSSRSMDVETLVSNPSDSPVARQSSRCDS
jgi:hypothetical protein